MHIFHQIIKEREVNGSLNFKNQLDRRHQLISLIESCLEGILSTQVFLIIRLKSIKTLGKRFLSKGLERKCETPAGKTCQGETPQAQRCRGGFLATVR
ncbi:hypothetical protein CQ056_21550 [Peribacillus simplex]|nr:hypothetical protein CQ056_21550 [Peribacillus simplex]